jgi:hypothetical protein
MSTALLPLDAMRCRRCQLVLAALARAVLAALRGQHGVRRITAAVGDCAETGPALSRARSRRP